MKTPSFNGGIPAEFLTTPNYETARIPTDSQPSSFKDNRQYRLFDRIIDLAPANQLVYRLDSANSISVYLRSINIWQGGRTYLVYPADGNETFTGSFSDISDQLFPTNGKLRPGLSSHPVTGVTVQKAIGPAIFSSTSKPRNGTAMLTDGNANRASSSYTANGDQGGVAEGQGFYLVFDHIGAANNTNGLFLVAYEEDFPA